VWRDAAQGRSPHALSTQNCRRNKDGEVPCALVMCMWSPSLFCWLEGSSTEANPGVAREGGDTWLGGGCRPGMCDSTGDLGGSLALSQSLSADCISRKPAGSAPRLQFPPSCKQPCPSLPPHPGTPLQSHQVPPELRLVCVCQSWGCYWFMAWLRCLGRRRHRLECKFHASALPPHFPPS
jgi:hypothetical protein